MGLPKTQKPKPDPKQEPVATVKKTAEGTDLLTKEKEKAKYKLDNTVSAFNFGTDKETLG